jgi:hypothetical protein
LRGQPKSSRKRFTTKIAQTTDLLGKSKKYAFACTNKLAASRKSSRPWGRP